MSYDKKAHALISRISPKINPTLKLGHSCLVENVDIIQFEHNIELDEELSSYTCSFIAASDHLVVDDPGEINRLVTVAGAVFIPTPSGFRNVGTAMGIQLGEGVGDFTHLSDDSVFYMEENGFAVKSNVLYPIKMDKSGYAGLVGTADKYFPRGLISRKGSIDIEMWNYLDTLLDFGGSTGVKASGLRISEMDGVDCNLELIYVAEPKLDPAEIAILVPSEDADIELDKNFTVSGTSNCSEVKIEASADGTTWVELEDALAVSGGTFSKTDCQLSSDDFSVNDTITIRVSDVEEISMPDTVDVTVASGTFKVQLQSENCDFTTVASVPITGTNRIAILGSLSNVAAHSNIKIGGVTVFTVVSPYNPIVIIVYDISTQSIIWANKYVNNVNQSEVAKGLIQDADYLYAVSTSETEVRIAVSKWSKTDGTVTGNTVSIGHPVKLYTPPSIVSLGDYVYLAYARPNTQIIVARKVTKSDLTIGSEVQISTKNSNGWYSVFAGTDGTDLFFCGTVDYAGNYVFNVTITRTDTNLANQTEYKRWQPTKNNMRCYGGFHIDSDNLFVALRDENSDYTDKVDYITDDTETTGALYNVYTVDYAKNMLFGRRNPTVKRFDISDMSTVFTKDYSADNVTAIANVVNVGNNKYIVGYIDTGDFDGNHASNTKKCAIIGKIGIDTGNL
jgi:hypothetical protein